MGKLRNYRVTAEVVADREDGFVHEELKQVNSRNGIAAQENGKRFLTDKEIEMLVEQYVKDDDTIALAYEEISKRRKDKDFKYSLIKQGVSMSMVSKFCDMGIARPSAMKLCMGIVNVLYDLYVAQCQQEQSAERIVEAKEPEKKNDAVPMSVTEEILEESEPGRELAAGIKRIGSVPQGISFENAVIEAGKIGSLMDMMDAYYFDYVSAEANEKMEAFYCVFDIMKKRYNEFEQSLQSMAYGK